MQGRWSRTGFEVVVTAAVLMTALVTWAPGDPAGADGNEMPGAPAVARSLSAGGVTTCARRDGGQVTCWGQNGSGELGLGDTANRGDDFGEMGANLASIDLGPGRTATAVSAGRHHTCVLLDTAQVKCWGDNVFGQLGLGDQITRGDDPGELGAALPAVDLGPGRSATAVVASFQHTCAILDNGQVKCWGNNGDGQLGQGDTARRGDAAGEMGANLPPVDLGPGRTAEALTAGFGHTCALLDNGQVKCWGRNLFGQLGLGDVDTRGDGAGEMGAALPPVDLGPGRTATALSASNVSTCALLDNALVKCWGSNGDGQLGQGDATIRGDGPGEMGADLPPIDLGPGRSVTGIAIGGTVACARLDNRQVKCWGGNNNGQLGQGDTTDRGDDAGEMGANLLPVDLGPGRAALAVTVGDTHACARLDDHTLRCWGSNLDGELGLGDRAQRGDGAGEMGAALPRVGVTLLGCDRKEVTVDIGLGGIPTSAADVILGTSAADTINGLGGNDRICGGGGIDTVNGGIGNDRLFGDAGNDTLRGAVGNDNLNGLAGLDTLDGGGNNDRLNGGTQRDTCHGRAGSDSQSGCEVRTGIP